MYIRHCIDLVGDISDLAQLTSKGERVSAARAAEMQVAP
jgi:hypothetical protein